MDIRSKFHFGVYAGLIVMLILTGCYKDSFQTETGFKLYEGDLLFQDLNSGELCDSIEKVTTGYKGANLLHVGIVAEGPKGNFVVIEALNSGVWATPLQSFLERSLDAQGKPKMLVGRLDPELRHLIPSAIKEALALIGKPYDKAFVIGNDSYYCSELIYEIFLRANNGKPVFQLRPMTFKDPDTGITLSAWREYFSKLDVPIPEDEPGINPGGISRSPVLTVVYAYGIPSGWQQKL